MSENYTAEDFAQANLATKGRFGVARRTDRHDAHQWHAYGYGLGWLSDEDMARDGWVPVAEATEATQNRHDVAAHLGQISSLSKRLVAAGDQIESQRIALEDLREENARLERIIQAPLSMRDLEVAWEAAEVPTADAPIREGDVIIVRHGGGFAVEPADRILSGQTHGRERVLSRAPREPWADLADALRAHTGEPDPDETARMLYEYGVRVTGGEES